MSDAPGTGPGSVDPAARPADLDRRRKAHGASLTNARQRHAPPADGAARATALGMAFRVGTEFVAGLLVGGVIGWFLDDWLGTAPLFFLLFLALGAAAAMMNVFRQAYRMNRAVAEAGKSDGAGEAGRD